MEGAAFFLGVLAFFTALAALKIGCVGIAVWRVLTAPERARRAAAIYEDRPWRCAAVGLVNLAVLALLAAVLLNAPPLRLFGLLALGLWLSLAALAYGPAYHAAARRLRPGVETPLDWRAIAAGGLAAEAAYLAPAIGQALSAAALVRGAGAVVLAQLGPAPRDEDGRS